jgi:hypothetical protein
MSIGGAGRAEQLSHYFARKQRWMVSKLVRAPREVDEDIYLEGRNCGCGTFAVVGFDAM